MESVILKEMISIIRAEEQRRAALLSGEDPEAAYDQWLFRDAPFVNELCIILLVALRHRVERVLVSLAALSADGGREIEGEQYGYNVEQLRKGRGWKWKEIDARLKPELSEFYRSMEALRLLANSYKHEHSERPAEDLKDFLGLPRVDYDVLPASDLFRQKLAVFIGLGEDATYCDIADRFVDVAESFLKDVKSRATLSKIKRHFIPLGRFAH